MTASVPEQPQPPIDLTRSYDKERVSAASAQWLQPSPASAIAADGGRSLDPSLPVSDTATLTPTIESRRKSSAPPLQIRTAFTVNVLASPREDDETDSQQVADSTLVTPRPSSAALSAISKESLYGGASPGTPISSPALAALRDVTPLPSPIGYSQSPDLWRKVTGGPRLAPSDASNRHGIGFARTPSPGRKKKTYPSLSSAQASTADINHQNHAKNRSISDYVPNPLHNVKPRTVTMGPVLFLPEDKDEHHMHREEHIATQRGAPVIPLSTKVSSSFQSSSTNNHVADDEDEEDWDDLDHEIAEEQFEILEVQDPVRKKARKWKPLNRLGQGAFSEVFLAKEEDLTTSQECKQPTPGLVAIKVVKRNLEQGSDEERVGTGLKREIEILQSISHPCLPQLLGFDENHDRTLLVLNYCPGGDLFELASQQRDLLTPALTQRVFAELVGAVSYLHGNFIVHRDIKLENVLLNIPITTLSAIPSPPNTCPHPLITLTDLGLSRRISSPPDSPLLTHACGSADYAAPELLLGQAYDGRATDAWALGVLLYALLEGRLPFDPLGPGPNGRRRAGGGSVKHRIARVDWMWVDYGDEDGEWKEDTKKGQQMIEASRVVDGCLKKAGRGRWSVQKIGEVAWVREGITVKGGLRRAEEEETVAGWSERL